MKRYLYLGLTFLLLGCAEQSGDSPTASLEELRGQWVVINYWAQWCKPCIEEIPELNALDQKYEQVTVLGVNYDGAIGEALAQQQTRLGLAFASLEADPSAQLGIPRPIVLPTTLILDSDGQLAASLVGPQTIESLERAMNLTTNGTPP